MVSKDLGKRVTQAIIVVLGAILLLIFLASPLQDIKNAALFNLLLLGVLGGVIYTGATEEKQERIIDWFEIKDRKDFFKQAGIGVIFGFIGLIVLSLVLQSIQAIQSFTGAVNYSMLASLTVDGALFAAVINPITEVFILVGLTLALRHYLPKKLIYGALIAAIFVAFLFGAFHFGAKQVTAASSGIPFPYETSIGGLINSVTDTQNLGSPNYVGAFPQVLLGLFWIILALVYKSFVVPITAHLTSNSVILFLSGPQNPEIINMLLLVFLILGIIVAISVRYGLFEQLASPKLEGLM